MTAIIPLPLVERERRAALARITGRDSQRPTTADWRMLAQHGATARREREPRKTMKAWLENDPADHFDFSGDTQ